MNLIIMFQPHIIALLLVLILYLSKELTYYKRGYKQAIKDGFAINDKRRIADHEASYWFSISKSIARHYKNYKHKQK